MARQTGGTVMAVRDLRVTYTHNGHDVAVLDELAFTLQQGEIVALLGESGSGKSTIAKAVTGLLPPSARIGGGTLQLGSSEPRPLGGVTDWGSVRGRSIGMLFQDARLALNPLMKVKAHFRESLVFHRIASADKTAHIAAGLLGKLGFAQPEDVLERYPFELSGGMCQRVCLALALCLEPDILIADEPTSALDTVAQKEVLDLLKRLQRELGLAVLFITHDLAVANAVSSRVIVLNNGAIAEEGETRAVLTQPRSPYTRSLLSARTQTVHISEEGEKHTAPPASCARLPLLELVGLQKSFDRAILQDVHLTLRDGDILGVLGQSGSGKSTLARCMAGLETPDAGQVLLGGEDISRARGRRRRQYCAQLQLIFQDARASLNAGRTALQLVQEPLRYMRIGARSEREATARRWLEEVGITGGLQRRKPGELSTGQCQRVAIARALALRPKVLVCDEAVSALDMSVQAQILALLLRLRRQLGFAVVMISHDSRVLRSFCRHIAVMDQGRLCEIWPADAIYESRLPHTQLLLKCAGDMEAGL